MYYNNYISASVHVNVILASIMATPRKLDVEARVKSMKSRVEKCWKDDIKWELYPLKLKEVCKV